MNSIVVQMQAEHAVVVQLEGQAPVVVPQADPQTVVLAVGIQGVPGPRGRPGPAGGAALIKVGPRAIGGHSVVACDAAGELVAADATNPAHQGTVLGMVADAYRPGDEAVVQTGYVLEHAGWSLTTGPVLVGLSGQLAQALPDGALFAQVVGQAISPTRVLIDVQFPITLA